MPLKSFKLNIYIPGSSDNVCISICICEAWGEGEDGGGIISLIAILILFKFLSFAGKIRGTFSIFDRCLYGMSRGCLP